MDINNYNNIEEINNTAQENLRMFLNAYEVLENISHNSNMLTNIDYMKNRIKELLEDGTIKKDSYEYIQLDNTIKQAIELQSNPDKSINDTLRFYMNFSNFNDICERFVGDNNV